MTARTKHNKTRGSQDLLFRSNAKYVSPGIHNYPSMLFAPLPQKAHYVERRSFEFVKLV
jgi:hypothetical protein